jgi:hypothetical protein
MYLRDPCKFYPTYTRSQSPSGPATTPQNGSSCGTLILGGGGRSKKMTAAPTLRSAKIWTPEGPGTQNPILSYPSPSLHFGQPAFASEGAPTFRGTKKRYGLYLCCWLVFLNVVYSKPFFTTAVHMKEKNKSSWAGAFIQDYKCKAKQGCGGCELRVGRGERSKQGRVKVLP